MSVFSQVGINTLKSWELLAPNGKLSKLFLKITCHIDEMKRSSMFG